MDVLQKFTNRDLNYLWNLKKVDNGILKIIYKKKNKKNKQTITPPPTTTKFNILRNDSKQTRVKMNVI